MIQLIIIFLIYNKYFTPSSVRFVKMSFLESDMKSISYPIERMIRVRINKANHIQLIRYNNGLSRYHTIENGIGMNGLPLSCEKDGSHKPSPLRNIINARDIVPLTILLREPNLPFLQSLQYLIFILRISTSFFIG